MKRPSGLTMLAGALLVLMPALAVLQFRWVGQVSEAERERMERNLIVAAYQFAETYDSQIRRAALELQVWPTILRDASWDRYAINFDQWRSVTNHPALISNIYLISASPTGTAVELRRFDPAPDQRTFREIDWPAVLGPWRDTFEEDLRDFNAGRERRPFRSDSLVFVPMRRLNLSPGASGAQTQTFRSVFGYTVIELDLAYVRTRLLPDLAARHFVHSGEDSYLVSVVTNDREGRLIYRSDPAAPADPSGAAVTQPFFSDAFGPPRPGFMALAAAADSTPAAAAPAPAADGPGRRTEESSRWRLLVQHQTGSLEAAVSGARTRNLAISFGVLMLLTVSIGLLTVSSRRAQRLAQQQMEFVAGVSHELRTPVAVIKSAAENLSQGIVGNTDRVKRYGQMIEGEARRLAEMVERVLQYAGIESGFGFGAKIPLDAAEMINGAVDSALPLLGPDGVTVHRDLPASLPPVVGDASALRSAVQNLVANAVKYGGPDRWVGIRAEHVRSGRRPEVRITVSDHGPGIPAADLPHIFEPFYRGGDALARQVHGNGLGLSLVKRIVNAHGGQVTVTTRAGAGSSFTISLPAADVDSSTRVAHEERVAVHS